ncbi:MAG: diguanylate cyclase, partial [Candidatus Aminicenantes bacterium]|nr:diguanylate cyclase [Candidatus Aminicenantes bacterium]
MINLLIAEDDRVIRKIIEKSMKECGYNVFCVSDGEEAYRILENNNIQIAILDWMLPGIEGIELSRRIRSDKEKNYTYIILLTSKKEQADMIDGFSAGVDDYITKPFDTNDLKARVKTGKRIIELQNQLIESQNRLREQATHDGLTNLLNRNAIFEIIEMEFARALRDKSPMGMIMMDIDHFKKINDTYGHQTGDDILQEVALRLKNGIRPYDNIGRYGGEEFLVVLPNCSIDQMLKVADRLRLKISGKKFKTRTKSLDVSISMGIIVAEYPYDKSPELLIKVIDKALYEAKDRGRNCWVSATPSNNNIGG